MSLIDVTDVVNTLQDREYLASGAGPLPLVESIIPMSPVNTEPKSTGKIQLLIGTPTLGIVRMEWANAMRGMISPPNFAVSTSCPQGYTVADAQNLLVATCLNNGHDALLLIEDDTCPPAEALIVMDRWLWKMQRKLAPPVISGLYHIKGSAEVRTGDTGGIEILGPEPLIYRGNGQRAHRDWKPGDVVWCSGVPTGALLVHRSVLEAWAAEPDVEAYMLPGVTIPIKKIFQNPSHVWKDDNGATCVSAGTSDLWWSEQTIKRGILAKAGWPAEFAEREFPFIVDTSLRFSHVDRQTGQQW